MFFGMLRNENVEYPAALCLSSKHLSATTYAMFRNFVKTVNLQGYISGGLYRPGYNVGEFRSYPGLVSDCAQDFRLEQSSSSFEKIPLGLSARSIVPHPPTMMHSQPHQLDLCNEFSSAPATSHPFSGSRYDPANVRTLNEMLLGNSAPPNAHLQHSPSSVHASQQLREDDALLLKLLLEQKKEDERQRNERVQELLLRHSQQRYQQIAQQAQQQQQKLMQLREQQVNQMSSEDLFSLYKQHQLFQVRYFLCKKRHAT